MDFDPEVGLLGEVEQFSGMGWEYCDKLFQQSDPNEVPPHHNFARSLASRLEWRRIPLGTTPHRIPSIVLFTRRAAIEEIDGFHHFGGSKDDAVAAELAFSLEIAGRGRAISRVALRNFHFLGHSEWQDSGRQRIACWYWEVIRSCWLLKNRMQVRLGFRRASRKQGLSRPFPPPGGA